MPTLMLWYDEDETEPPNETIHGKNFSDCLAQLFTALTEEDLDEPIQFLQLFRALTSLSHKDDVNGEYTGGDFDWNTGSVIIRFVNKDVKPPTPQRPERMIVL